MKQLALIVLLLFVSAGSLYAQKNLLIASILQEGTNAPASGVEIRIAGLFKEPLTTFTTGPDGEIEYRTNQKVLYLEIRSTDLNFQSTFEKITLVPNDTSRISIKLAARDPKEVKQIQQGLQKLPMEINQQPYTCTDYTQQDINVRFIDSCLTANLHYPEKAREMNLRDKVQVKFFVDKNGKVCNIELSNPTYAILEEEILRVVSSLSDMPIAVCKGKKFPAFYVLPVSFGEE